MTQVELNYSVPAQDRKRLSRQCVALLERLRKGALTNVDAAVGFFGKDGKIVRVLNLTARVSELRQAGHDVRATRIDGGLWSYRLIA